MRPRRPDTFILTLPDGKMVRCWRKDRPAIRRDVALTGKVMLVQSPDSEVYDRVAPGSLEAAALAPAARRIG